MWRALASFFFLLLLIPARSASGQLHEGSIRGSVLTADGAAVSDAHVSAEAMQGSTILTVLEVNTDDMGMFVFSGLAPGEYRVSAEKQEAGYLSTRPDVFIPKAPLTVVLTSETQSVTTDIRFAPKAGNITGWVRDSATGRAIAAHLSLAPASHHGGWETTGTNPQYPFHLQIPADLPVRFGACAEGYKLWFYADPSNPFQPSAIQLRPGGTKEIEIRLERNPEGTPMPCLSCRY